MKRSLAHTVWECKYHVVWVPKNRRKIVYGKLKRDIVKILKGEIGGNRDTSHYS